MALPTTADAKTWLRVQTTAEDTRISALVTRATAMVRSALGRPITVEAKTFTDYAETRRLYGVVQNLLIPTQYLPAVRADDSTVFAPVVTDADGLTVSATTDYYVGEPWDALLKARSGITFGNGPYTVTVYAGLAAADDYDTVIEPSLSAAILDVVADLHQRMNPNASNESAGGGVSTSYGALGIPQRAWEQIRQWAVIRV